MTTKQIELRTEIARKRIVLQRISQPDDNRAAFAPVVLLMIIGGAALLLAASAVIHAIS